MGWLKDTHNRILSQPISCSDRFSVWLFASTLGGRAGPQCQATYNESSKEQVESEYGCGWRAHSAITRRRTARGFCGLPWDCAGAVVKNRAGQARALPLRRCCGFGSDESSEI